MQRPSKPIELVNAATGQIGALPGTESLIVLASSSQGEFLVGRIHDQLAIWDKATNRIARTRLLDRPVTSVTFSPDAATSPSATPAR